MKVACYAGYRGEETPRRFALESFPRVHVFRPGYIYPVEPRREPNVAYRIFRGLDPVLKRLYPNLGIASDDLAHPMVDAGLHGTPAHPSPILENRDLRALVRGGGRSLSDTSAG